MSTLDAVESPPGWTPGEPVHLITPKFIIRSLEPDDVDERLLSWFGNEDFMFLMGSAPRRSQDKLRRYVSSMDNIRNFLLGIFARDTGLVVGWFRAYHYSSVGRTKLNILIGDKLYRGRKNTSELNQAIHDFLFDDMRVHKVYTTVFGFNIHSRRLVERSGYQIEGQLRDHEVRDDGSWFDVIWYGMLESDWRAARKKVETRT